MSSVKTPPVRAAAALCGTTLILIVIAVLITGSPGASAATTGQLQQQIAARQGNVSALSGAVSAASGRVSRLGATVSSLQQQVDHLQADLGAKRDELIRLQSQQSTARTRLAQLETSEAHSESVLSQQLVGSYEADRPDLVSVVLESTGFPNLLERLSFAQRVGSQDANVVGQVKAARRAVAAEATHVGALYLHQSQLTTTMIDERNSVDRTRLTLVSEQLAATRVRDNKAGRLSSARASVSALRAELVSLRAAQAAQAAQAARTQREAARRAVSAPSSSNSSQSSPSPAPAPSHGGSSSGGFTFPLPTSAASPPGTWSPDDGVDISAPGGTPEYAVCSGTIVLHGIGGFGPSAPVIHCDSPLSGYDYVYYGHAGPGNWTPVGAHVSQGQVISEVGYGDVGISTGPHLEIGFADSSGAPVGPSSASAMLALLRASYGG